MDFYWINRCFVSIQFAPLICRDFELSRFSGFWIGYLWDWLLVGLWTFAGVFIAKFGVFIA